MRKIRKEQLHTVNGIVHEFWQIHNQQFYLQSNSIKRVLFKCMFFALRHKTLESNAAIRAFCFMDNHAHQIVHYQGGSKFMSLFMKLMNGEFARRFHRIFNTSGALNNGRPKTKLLDRTTAAEMQAQMYVEANPLRARNSKWKVENLKLYTFNSFRFYAYGICDEFTEILETPSWYLALGSTPKKRQKRYRSLFKRYVDKEMNRMKKGDLIHSIAQATSMVKIADLTPAREQILKQIEDRLDRLLQGTQNGVRPPLHLIAVSPSTH